MTQKRLFHHGLSLVILSSQSIINNKMPAKMLLITKAVMFTVICSAWLQKTAVRTDAFYNAFYLA